MTTGNSLAVASGRVAYAFGLHGSAISVHSVLDSGLYFIPKPITPEPLLQKIREVLSG